MVGEGRAGSGLSGTGEAGVVWEERASHKQTSIGISGEMFALLEKNQLLWQPNVFFTKLSPLVGE